MLTKVISVIGTVASANTRNDDDLVDRLNHRYTVMFLFIFTAVVSTTQYVGTPIYCWCPAYFKSSHESFTMDMCWVTNNYYLPTDEIAGQPGALKAHLGYYQWVPIVLLIQAVFFFIPCCFWRICADRSGINIYNLVEAADTIQNALYPERREKTIRYMIRHLDHYLDYQREYRGGCCTTLKHCLSKRCFCLCGNRYGNYLMGLYFFTKLSYLVNVTAQLFALNIILGTDYHLYGIKVMMDLLTGGPVIEAPIFPRVTLCDFQIRQMGSVHRHTVQCVLPINLFNEKIFIFLWFWYMFVSLSTVFSLCRWIWLVGVRHRRIYYIRKHLKIMDRLNRDSDRERKLTLKFAENYLKQDGILVLKLVAKNSTELVVADIVAALWDNYKEKIAKPGMDDSGRSYGRGGRGSQERLNEDTASVS